MEEYLTVRQAAEQLQVSTAALYKAIRSGRLPAITLVDRVALHPADVNAYRDRKERIGPLGGRPRKERRPRGRPRKQLNTEGEA